EAKQDYPRIDDTQPPIRTDRPFVGDSAGCLEVALAHDATIRYFFLGVVRARDGHPYGLLDCRCRGHSLCVVAISTTPPDGNRPEHAGEDDAGRSNESERDPSQVGLLMWSQPNHPAKRRSNRARRSARSLEASREFLGHELVRLPTTRPRRGRVTPF